MGKKCRGGDTGGERGGQGDGQPEMEILLPLRKFVIEVLERGGEKRRRRGRNNRGGK